MLGLDYKYLEEVGDRAFMRKAYGIDGKGVAAKIIKAIK